MLRSVVRLVFLLGWPWLISRVPTIATCCVGNCQAFCNLSVLFIHYLKHPIKIRVLQRHGVQNVVEMANEDASMGVSMTPLTRILLTNQ